MEIEAITGEDLQRVLARMSGAPGADGWRVNELKALPLSILNALAEMLNLIEKAGKWPKGMQLALISLIPKSSGIGPTNLRPIS
eukprot:4415865-Karenia_brevis.AAC.1